METVDLSKIKLTPRQFGIILTSLSNMLERDLRDREEEHFVYGSDEPITADEVSDLLFETLKDVE